MNGFIKTAFLTSAIALGAGSIASADLPTSPAIVPENLQIAVDQAKNSEVKSESKNLTTDVTLAPGPFVGFPVYSSDGIKIGSVISSETDVDTMSLTKVVFKLDNDKDVQMDGTEVANMGAEALMVSLDAKTILSRADQAFNTLEVLN
jgi:hypothetical protein